MREVLEQTPVAYNVCLDSQLQNYASPIGSICVNVERFVSFRRGDYPQERLLHLNQVARIVKQRAHAVGITMSLHGMRASFITLAFENYEHARAGSMARTTEG
jgi:hypothetical protein